MYVALSHVSDIKNLHLIGTYNQNAFPVNSYVTSEYDRLQESSYFIPCSTLNMNSSSLTVSLLNTRSLRGHLQDIVKDKKSCVKWSVVFDRNSGLSWKWYIWYRRTVRHLWSLYERGRW